MDFKSLRTQSSLAVIITAAVLVEITSGIQYYFAKEGIRQEGDRLRWRSMKSLLF